MTNEQLEELRAKAPQIWVSVTRNCPPRYQSYLDQALGDHLTALETYLWNIELRKAIVPVLNGVEVLFKNALDHSIKRNRVKLSSAPDYWFLPVIQSISPVSGSLRETRLKQLKASLERQLIAALRAVNKKLASGSKVLSANAPDPDWLSNISKFEHNQIVSELNFSFWIMLLDVELESQVYGPAVGRLFRRGTQTIPRHVLSDDLQRLKDLRNRTYHNERICNDPYLMHKYEKAKQIVSGIDPDYAKFLGLVDKFRTVFANGKDHIRQSLYEEYCAKE